jgi:hypothetical protein
MRPSRSVRQKAEWRRSTRTVALSASSEDDWGDVPAERLGARRMSGEDRDAE